MAAERDPDVVLETVCGQRSDNPDVTDEDRDRFADLLRNARAGIWYGPCERCGTSHGGSPRTHIVGQARCVEAQSRRITAHSEALAALAQEVGTDA